VPLQHFPEVRRLDCTTRAIRAIDSQACGDVMGLWLRAKRCCEKYS